MLFHLFSTYKLGQITGTNHFSYQKGYLSCVKILMKRVTWVRPMSDMSWAKFKREQQGQQREWSELGWREYWSPKQQESGDMGRRSNTEQLVNVNIMDIKNTQSLLSRLSSQRLHGITVERMFVFIPWALKTNWQLTWPIWTASPSVGDIPLGYPVGCKQEE